jgi:hypothetical protein
VFKFFKKPAETSPLAVPSKHASMEKVFCALLVILFDSTSLMKFRAKLIINLDLNFRI